MDPAGIFKGAKIEVTPDKTITVTPSDAASAALGRTSSGSLGTSGPYDIVQFRTGAHKTGEVTGGNLKSEPESYVYKRTDNTRNQIKKYEAPSAQGGGTVLDGLPQVEGELREVLGDNIKFVQEEIPGFKPFGSSVGVSEDAMSHVTHDIDGYLTKEDFAEFSKTHKLSPRVEGETYTYQIKDGQFGE